MKGIRTRYALFLGSIALAIIASQLIIQYDLNLQNADAKFINLAGRQRMLGQRISKVILYLHTEMHENGEIHRYRLDTLQKTFRTWREVHNYLRNENEEIRHSPVIAEVLRENSVHVKAITSVCKAVIKNPNREIIDRALDTINVHDVPYLLSMEKTVSIYQAEAENKLAGVKKLEWILAAFIILVLCLGFIFLVLPATQKLITLNRDLQKSEERYRLVSENSQDFIALHEPDGTYTYVSPSAKDLLGYEPAELVGRTGYSMIHPDDLPRIYQAPTTDTLSGKVVLGIEFRMRKKDGSYTWVDCYTKPMTDETGKVVQVQTCARDISIRKAVEEKLKESEKLYRLISTNAKDLISLYDAIEDPKRIFISPSCKDIMGYTQEEMLNRSPYDFIVPEDAEELKRVTHPTTMSGRSAVREYRAIRKDGSIIWLESISNPFFDLHNNMIGFQTSARDVTQRKMFEKELVLAKDTSDRASERLRKLLEEKDDLIGLLSHDMRAPINQVRGLLGIVKISLDSPDAVTECLSRIEEAVDRQENLFKNVLSMLQSDQRIAGADPLITKPLRILIEEFCRNLEWDLQNKKLGIVLSIPKTIDVTVQQNFFGQAIHNLLTNAIKFSPSGTEIKIEAEENDETIRLAVRDSGIGFNPEKAERLFDRFTREGRMGTNNEKSTGLGLYLVRKIIENHNGIITAHSDGEGKGSTFTILLNKSNHTV